MIITEISRQAKNANRYNIFIDGEFAFGISDFDLLNQRLFKGMEIDAALLDKLQNELEYTKARDVAVAYLGRSPRSAAEIKRKLTEKEFSSASINRVMDLLTDNGYIDDVTFAVQLISHRTKTSNHGKRRIVGELVQKGVAKDDIIAAYHHLFDEDEGENEIAAATAALAKKLRNINISDIADNAKELSRLTAFLARRGFGYDVIKKVMANILNEENAG